MARTDPELDPHPLPPAQRSRLERVNALAQVLDNSIRVPGTSMHFGWDAVIGLVPGVGDVIGGILSSYIVMQAARAGAPVAVLLRMLLNLAIEAGVGTFPILGDLFDAGFKANLRNVRLLQQSIEAPGEAHRASTATVGGVMIALLIILAAFGYAAFLVLRGVLMLFQGEPIQA